MAFESISGLTRIASILTMALLVTAVPACSRAASSPAPDLTPSGPSTSGPSRSWEELQLRSPFPYTLPLPPPESSVLDGTYCKVDPKKATPVPCKRCPDYAPEGGLWVLGLEVGVFRLWHECTRWRSLGSFVLFEDRRSLGPSNRLVLFNDPVCPETVGVYEWTLENEMLILTVVDDPCGIKLRAMNLTKQPWLPCQPQSPKPTATTEWPSCGNGPMCR